MNNDYICENCGKNHDGSYGTGRFCSKFCSRSFCAKQISEKTKIEKMKKLHEYNKTHKTLNAEYGTWTCRQCGEIFNTRRELEIHRKTHLRKDENGNIISWRRGLTKETDESIARQSKTFRENIANGKNKLWWKGRHHSAETIKKLSLHGGKRPHSGRGKQGRYNGIWCDSSWELAFLIYSIENKISVKRYEGFFEYEFEGIKRKYYPDFELSDGTIVEIKGYTSRQWEAKLKYFPKDKKLIIIGKNEIKKYINYVIEKYGKDFINLYDPKTINSKN